jgi:hypothetical protein
MYGIRPYAENTHTVGEDDLGITDGVKRGWKPPR